MLALTLLLACADKGATPTESGGAESGADSAESGGEEPSFACTGLAGALPELPERDPDVTLFFPSAECASGVWTFEARTFMADRVAEQVWALPWDARTGAFGAALALTDDGAGTFTGEALASEVGFSCTSELARGFVFAPAAEGRLGVLGGMGGRGGAIGAGWGMDGSAYDFEFVVDDAAVLSAELVACNPVSGVGWGPYPLADRGVYEDREGTTVWGAQLSLGASGMGEDWEVLAAGLGLDAEGAVVASYFGGG